MPRLTKPRALGPDATLAIAAPGGPVDPERLEEGEALFAEAGFRTVRRRDLLDRDGYLAGDDRRRAEELMAWVRDPDVDGIVCARGGYGCDRILPLLDPAPFREAAKPLVGYSDVTALLLWQRRRAGLMGFHGPMLDRGKDVGAAAFASLVAQLRGEGERPLVLRGESGQGGHGGQGGEATGRLTGGSLTLVAASIGTDWEVDTRGAILLLEDVAEPTYRVDRMLQQLRGAGKLEGLAGVGIGDFATCVDERYPDRDVPALFRELLEPRGIPWVAGLPFGHLADNAAWPLGARATLDAERAELRVLERGVQRR